jgi:hypothetical protein
MNKSYSKIKHILNANLLLENRLLSEQTYGGISQEALNAILAVSEKNKKGFSGSYLFPAQQTEIDNKFGEGTYSKFYRNGGETLLKTGKSTFPNIYNTAKSFVFDWSQYPCVSQSKNVVPVTLSDGTIAYKGGGFYYYGNKRKRNIETGEMSDWHCDPSNTWKINAGVDANTQTSTTNAAATTQTGGNVSSGMGMVLITPQQVATLRTNAGLTGTGSSLTQKDINDLYSMFFHQLQKK